MHWFQGFFASFSGGFRPTENSLRFRNGGGANEATRLPTCSARWNVTVSLLDHGVQNKNVWGGERKKNKKRNPQKLNKVASRCLGRIPQTSAFLSDRPSMSSLIMPLVWARPRLPTHTRCNLFNLPLSRADKAWPPNARLHLTQPRESFFTSSPLGIVAAYHRHITTHLVQSALRGVQTQTRTASLITLTRPRRNQVRQNAARNAYDHWPWASHQRRRRFLLWLLTNGAKSKLNYIARGVHQWRPFKMDIQRWLALASESFLRQKALYIYGAD